MFLGAQQFKKAMCGGNLSAANDCFSQPANKGGGICFNRFYTLRIMVRFASSLYAVIMSRAAENRSDGGQNGKKGEKIRHAKVTPSPTKRQFGWRTITEMRMERIIKHPREGHTMVFELSTA